jgi:hypothetical protein
MLSAIYQLTPYSLIANQISHQLVSIDIVFQLNLLSDCIGNIQRRYPDRFPAFHCARLERTRGANTGKRIRCGKTEESPYKPDLVLVLVVEAK